MIDIEGDIKKMTWINANGIKCLTKREYEKRIEGKLTTKCYQCGREKLSCWNEIKGKPYCMKCYNSFFSFKINQPVTRKCRCCGYWKKLGYEDTDYKHRINLCFNCAKELGFIPIELGVRK